MNLNEYSKKAQRTMVKLENINIDKLHMVIGISTESGELLDVFKKQLAYKKELDITNIKEEIGDIMYYVVNFCNLFGFDLEEVLDINIAKLKARYPEKFTEEKANNRDLVYERVTLEKAGKA